MQLPGSVDIAQAAPVVVLGLGNRLLKDDGVGVELVSLLEPVRDQWGSAVELIDGGTRGLALLGAVLGRAAVVFLDAVKLGTEPGSVHVLSKEDLLGLGGRATTAHEGGAKELLAAMALLGESPAEIAVIGVEPETMDTGIGLSDSVRARLVEAAIRAEKVIGELVRKAGQ